MEKLITKDWMVCRKDNRPAWVSQKMRSLSQLYFANADTEVERTPSPTKFVSKRLPTLRTKRRNGIILNLYYL